MKDSIKNRKKHFLALCLSVMMLSSTAAFAACSDSSTDSSSSSSSSAESTAEVKDDGLIKNAGFETFDEDDAINTSVTGWTRSVNSSTSGSASSSKAASGIIDLSSEGKKKLMGSYYDDPETVKTLTEAQAEAVWDKLTVKDKLTYYKAWEENNEDGDIDKDLDFYESINIDLGDIPSIADDFDTHDKAVENGGKDTKVLMLHNEYPEPDSTSATYKAQGTAQKYTSSSTVTVKAGTSAQFSVWVRTQDLQSSATDGTAQEAIGKGAYISITHSVGGTSLDEYKVENIDTERMESSALTNGWAQYTFILKGSSYADTTFSLVLGLGQGGNTYRGEYVNGYAFFDDIKCDIIEDKTYDDTLQDWVSDYGFDETNDVINFTHEGEAKVVDLSKENRNYFAMDFHGPFDPPATDVWVGVTPKATTSKVNGADISSIAGQNPAAALGAGIDGSTDVTAVFDNGAAINAGNSATVYNEYFKDDTIATGKTLLLLSQKGGAYTAELAENTFTVPAEGYLALSLFVKTSDMEGATGGGITLKNDKTEVSFTSIDTTDVDPVDIGEKKDIYNGWQKYFFFVKNVEETEQKFTLAFHFGPTEIDPEAGKDSYHYGFAAFTDVQVRAMDEAEYNRAQEGSYAKLVTLGEEEEESAGSLFDSAIGAPTNALKEGLANPQNYKGVYTDSAYILGAGSKEVNTYANAGLINKEEFTKDGGYYGTASGAWLTAIKDAATDKTSASTVWASVFGDDSTQPLYLYNDGSADQLAKAYGFIGKSTSVAANSYAAVSVRVKGTGANAYVRLINTDSSAYGDSPAPYNKTMSIGGKLTYWYDDDGNICTGDPAKKSSQVAFKLQPNGLYKANKLCVSVYGTLTEEQKNAWYANLDAYTETDSEGNKLVAKNGASHNYTSYWNNEGMDGIAYYYKDGAFYADKAKTIPVTNLASVLPAENRRFEGTAEKSLETTIPLSSTAWTTVTFYLHTGDTAKNYRLELWSGAKSGDSITPNGANTYVIFDYNNVGTAEDNFTNLLADEDYTESATDKFESVFSYFDTANYLRYNKNLDEAKIGNLYEENYTPSSYEDGIAYLYKETTTERTFFADYQYSEKTVAASAEEDAEEEENTSNEEDGDTNIWLLASSLAIAGVLLLAIVSIVVRKLVVKSRKKRAAQSSVKKAKKDKKSK